MIELKVAATAVTDPREWKRLMLDAASRGATAIDEATGMIYLLRHRDIERLLNEPRVHGVGLSFFDAMGIAGGPLRDWYGALMFTNDGTRHDRLRRLVRASRGRGRSQRPTSEVERSRCYGKGKRRKLGERPSWGVL